MRFRLWSALAVAVGAARAQSAPIADHHQHLFNPVLIDMARALSPAAAAGLQPITAKDLVALLDSAGIRKALVLSIAYQLGNPARTIDNEYERVKAENDWTAAQVAQYPDRLRAFCGVNPLESYALDEIARCSKDPRLRYGLKLHFGNSDIDVHDSSQVEQLRRVFRAANEYGMAIVMHMHANVNKRRPYGAAEARIMLADVLPSAPDVPIQIAHLAGAGGYDDGTDEALGVFADAFAGHDPRVAHVYIDVSGVVDRRMTPEKAKVIAARIRQIGVDRFLFGADAATGGNLAPGPAWTAFRTTIPLTDAELRAIAGNLAPYMRW